ncbi:DUF2398 family protein [Actinorhabdospora filicis]|nr:DUF2398 family protein [Actinorhabdospora filicis]
MATLLSRPVLPAADAGLPAVRRRETELAARLGDEYGRGLLVDAAGARVIDPRASLLRADGSPFTPRMYACLLLAVAVLPSVGARVTAAELDARVTALAGEAGIDPGAEGPLAWRRAVAEALLTLRAWGVVGEIDGGLSGYAEDGEDALLAVDAALARLLPLEGGAS